MKHVELAWLVTLAILPPLSAFASDRIYRSVDGAGQVTYSSQPPADAVEVEGLNVAPGPSAHAAEDARTRVMEMEQRTDARYQAMMERRRLETQARREAREEAENRRAEREAADRLRRIDESLERHSTDGGYYRRYPYDWRWPYRPPHPIRPVHPPRRPHWNYPPNRPYDSHINTPARNR